MSLKIVFDQSLNASLQLGDDVYFISNDDIGFQGDFNHSNIQPTLVGKVREIIHVGDPDASPPTEDNTIFCSNLDANGNDITLPANAMPNGGMFMFNKDDFVNRSSMVGYYAEVTMQNNSTDRAELYALGSNISVSSK